MDDEKGFAVTTTEIPLLSVDGRRHFARARPARERVLQWTVAMLWLSAAGITVAAVL